jgi:predicted transcriptional regulator of viral defense system
MLCMGTHRNSSANLFSVATDQRGFFTTKQAEAAGFQRQSHYYHVQTGDWIREHRGIYRLAHFPSAERPDLIRFWLWSRNREDVPQGVYSHETALSLHELSDAMPAKLHMTVPKTFRRMAATPRAIVLHRGDLAPADIGTLDGVPVTTPFRTVLYAKIDSESGCARRTPARVQRTRGSCSIRTMASKYATASAFRRALEDRLQSISQKDHIDLQRLRREVAFDRMLARLFASDTAPWVLKGGYLMELRLQVARSTRDVDLTLRGRAALITEDPKDSNQAVRELLEASASTDLSDFFVYVIGEAMMDLNVPAYGGARFPVEARVDGRRFVNFHIDIAIGDVLVEPLDRLYGHDWLEFAGIARPLIQAISAEQQFAEKLHAYTLPRQNPNSRVRDLLDMLLLVKAGKLSRNRTKQTIRTTFEKRKTHSVPDGFAPPPAAWAKPFAALAQECVISDTADEAFKKICVFLDTLALN